MKHEEKINYMRIACGIAGFSMKNEHMDLLVSMYELVVTKAGKTELTDVVRVEHEVKERAYTASNAAALEKQVNKMRNEQDNK